MNMTLCLLLLGSAIWIPSTAQGQDEISLKVESICRFRDFNQSVGPEIKVDESYDSYEWFQVSGQGLTIQGNLPQTKVVNHLQSLDNQNQLEDDSIPSAVLSGLADLLVRMKKGDTATFRRFHVVKNPRPKIVFEPESGLLRGGDLVLKTTEKYKSTTWTYVGVPEGDVAKKPRGNANLDDVGQVVWGYRRDRDNDDFHDYIAVTANGRVLRYEAYEAATPETYNLSSQSYFWVDETVRKTRVAPVTLDTAEDGSALDRPFFDAVYKVEVVDANGCRGQTINLVDVDQHLFEFQVGLDYSRASIDGAPIDDQPGSEETSSRDLFSDPEGFFGIHTQQYVRRFLVVYGDIRFGGTNVKPDQGQEFPLKEAQSFRGIFGIQYDWKCAPKNQVCIYGALEYGFIFLEESDERLPDDYLNTSFFGIGYRYHKPGSKFHGSHAEVGLGRSDNFDDNSERFKARAEVRFDLGQTWDFRLRGELDTDTGRGPDDLRILVGASRDLSFLGDVFAKVLGLGEKKN